MIQERHYQIRCQKHIIEASVNSPSVGDDFDNLITNLITHVLSCTLKDDVCAKKYDNLSFGSLHEMITREELECLGQDKRSLRQGKKKLKEGLCSCLEKTRIVKESALNEVKMHATDSEWQ